MSCSGRFGEFAHKETSERDAFASLRRLLAVVLRDPEGRAVTRANTRGSREAYFCIQGLTDSTECVLGPLKLKPKLGSLPEGLFVLDLK